MVVSPRKREGCQSEEEPRRYGIDVPKWRCNVTTYSGGSIVKLSAELPIIGMDIAKNVFQLHIVDPETGEVERKRKRDRVASFFANRPLSVVALEACGGAHYWGRTLTAHGHQVKLLPANQVRPLVTRDKSDARDAQAIWVAVQQPLFAKCQSRASSNRLVWPCTACEAS